MKKKIYQIKKGRVEVFHFRANIPRIIKFRIDEILKIPEDERVLQRADALSWFSSKDGVVFSCGGYVLKKIPKESDFIFSRIEERYIKGDFVGEPVVHTQRYEDNSDLYYLGPMRNASDNKIQLTENLYLAQLLENEDFSNEELQAASLEYLKSLFIISDKPVSTISLQQIKKMYEANLISGDYDSQIADLEQSGKILTKLR